MERIKVLHKTSDAVAVYELGNVFGIEYGMASDLYDKSDLSGNGLEPTEGILVITFKDGSLASFSASQWLIRFE